MKATFLCLVCLLPPALGGSGLRAEPVRFADPAAEIGRVVELMDRRLDLMPEVAAWKTLRHQPVSDPERERKVLDQSVAGAAAIHLDADAARRFFDVQIRMAKAVETRAMADGPGRGLSPGRPRDLATELRPALDGIGRDLLQAAYLASPALADAGEPALERKLAPLLRHPGVDPAFLAELGQALGALRLTAAADLATIQQVGVLRVGTTGDYPPFSSDDGGELRGFDIQLAQALAGHWRVRTEFVRTTWPTLMKDLKARRFDLALSGITATPERSHAADFSVAYCADGKTAIARRADSVRYATLAQIDEPGVRVIVNPGGTNERFVRDHLRKATLIAHADNRTIFDEIIAGRADVMITDGIEVRLQTRKHPELSGTGAVLTPTPARKAILLPAKSELTPAIDAWLAPQAASGQLAQQMDAARRDAE